MERLLLRSDYINSLSPFSEGLLNLSKDSFQWFLEEAEDAGVIAQIRGL
jgi:hypothetical protein